MTDSRLSFRTLAISSLTITLLAAGMFAFPSVWTSAGTIAATINGFVIRGSDPIKRDASINLTGPERLARDPFDDDMLAPTGTVYVWNQTGTAAFVTASNWTPARTTPATDDILTFNNGATTTVTFVPTQTVGQILVSGNTTVNLAASSTATLTVGGDAGTDLFVAPGSALNTTGTSGISLILGTGASGLISGNFTCAGAAHKLNAVDASGITFDSGAIFTQDPGCTGSAFNTTGTANAIVFASGSTFIQYAGANPFGLTAPNSKVVFQTGSLYSHRHSTSPGTLGTVGRTYANFELNAPGVNFSIASGTSPLSVDDLAVAAGNLTLSIPAGVNVNRDLSVASGATLNFNPLSPTGIFSFKGNISVSGTLAFAGSAPTFALSGTSTQIISGAGTISFTGNQFINISNAAGVNLQRNLDLVAAPLTVSGSGRLNFGTSFITGTGSTFTTSRTATLGLGSSDGLATGTTTGNLRISGIRTFIAGTTFVYNGSSNQFVGNGLPAAVTNLAIANTGTAGNNTVTGNAGQAVSNLVTLQSGTYASSAGTTTYGNVEIESGATFSAGGRSDVSGNWANNGGTFSANNNSVNFIGALAHTISGNTTFYNLVNIVNTNSFLNFGAGSITTITNELTLSAISGTLSLRSTTPGTRWKINSLGTNSMAGLDVQDSDASGGPTISAFGAINSGNNVNWSFGDEPEVEVAPASMSFGTQAVGSTSGTRSVTISNTGSADLNIGQLEKSGDNAGDFTITADPSNTVIAPAGTAKVRVTFSPSNVGSRNAQIAIPSNDSDEDPVFVSLSGTGTAAVTPSPVKSMWVWGGTPNPVTDPTGRADLIQRATAAGITDLYVSVYSSTPNSQLRQMFASSDIADLNASAHSAGMEVWAAYGDPAWQNQACSDGQSSYERMEEVAAFNAERPAADRFDGVMLDVEPGGAFNLTNYADVHNCFRGVLPADIKLGTAISAFWHTPDRAAVEYPVGGESKDPAQHIIDLPLDQIVVMGYRDNAGSTGGNGIIGLDEFEIGYASAIGKAGLVLVGLETKDLGDPPNEHVTFFEEGSAGLVSESAIVASHFAGSTGFGGFSIHAYGDEYLSGASGWPSLPPAPQVTTADATLVTGNLGNSQRSRHSQQNRRDRIFLLRDVKYRRLSDARNAYTFIGRY